MKFLVANSRHLVVVSPKESLRLVIYRTALRFHSRDQDTKKLDNSRLEKSSQTWVPDCYIDRSYSITVRPTHVQRSDIRAHREGGRDRCCDTYSVALGDREEFDDMGTTPISFLLLNLDDKASR